MNPKRKAQEKGSYECRVGTDVLARERLFIRVTASLGIHAFRVHPCPKAAVVRFGHRAGQAGAL